MKVLLADKLSTAVQDYLNEQQHIIMAEPSLKNDALKEALQQFQRSIFAITRESLVRTESLAVAERLRFEALARSVESPQRM